ncbi:LolA family protein [Blastomonas aquatica]|uniref:Outer-membrane lipoprotein carrier protein n=1 Tax=Blastomonas aquatica TaxID=1510276 RepID=A0ABQ1JN70_9SPHN|nr:outer membrane lipoprotein carrier protein LolA [Blastomonas aquatica]GGB70449.1 outer-membrane lipoprotein carrier protein [Blastomonas aquatica]
MLISRFKPIAAMLLATSIVAAPIATPTAAIGQQANPGGDLAQVSRHLKAMQSLRASFTQTDRSGQTLTGTLTLKQPGKIRFEYQKDAQLLIVSDGRALTMIDYQVKQVQRWPIRNSPLGALLDPNRDLTVYGTLLPTNDPDVVSVEVRDPKRPEYGVITLIFTRSAAAPGGLSLVGWVALDSQNKRTTIRLSGQQYNVAVADNAFAWTDPRAKGPRR